MRISIRARSNLSLPSTPRAALPSGASEHSTPHRLKMVLKSIRLYSSSSTISTLSLPSSEGTSATGSVSPVNCSGSPTLSGISHLTVVPSFFLLWNSIFPFIRSTSFLTIERPSPVPPYLRAVLISSWAKSSKMMLILSSSIPIPVSANSITANISPGCFAIPATEILTVPPAVNFTELLTRLIITCFSR